MSRCKYHGDLPYKVKGCPNCEAQASSSLQSAGSGADVPVLSILKRHLETSVQYQQVALKVGNPEGYAYVKIPDWEVRQIIEFLERQNESS